MAAASLLFLVQAASAQTTIADWTFESLTISAGSTYTNWSNGLQITNITSEVGSGTASGYHSTGGSSPWNTITGNGSSKALSGNGWSQNDYYQFAVSTLGFQNIQFGINVNGSATGPRDFKIQYSTDGVTFTDSGNTITVPASISWSSGTSNSATAFSFDLSSITAINDQSLVYFRVVVNSGTAINGSSIAAGGTSRIDNVAVSGSSLSPIPGFVSQPYGTNVYLGDWVTLSAIESGEAPLSNQWFYSSSGEDGTYVPLSDGPSGYGAGTIAGSATTSLSLHYVDPAQAGYYMLGVSNLVTGGSYVFSSPAQLTVGTRTPIVTNIAALRMQQDPVNWKPLDTTNLYTVTGIVTTPFNFTTSSGDEEFYIQDSTGCGISVFVYNDTTLPNPGDQVTVTAAIGQYDGTLQFEVDMYDPANSLSTVSTGNPLPAPKYFDMANWTNVALIETNFESSLVVVSNVFFAQGTPQFGPGVTVNMTNVNGGVLPAYVYASDSEMIGQGVPAFAASVAGVLGQFTTSTPANNGYELYPLHAADVVSGSAAIVPMTVQPSSATDTVVTWNASLFHLQSTTNLATGPWTDIVPSTSPYTNYDSVTNNAMFFRLAH
ncbi:MAG TPA: hypothetical protein VHG71_08980 [Verrucomicrobiae bacterium]|nr:hypothetical protein [Verrucomicrobiae bacterium]